MKTYLDKEDFLRQNGFDEAGNTYLITGGNTYVIKETLKELGYKYSNLLKWHGTKEYQSDNPEYISIKINFDDIYVWNDADKVAYFTVEAENRIRDAISATYPPSKSEYIGTLKERLRNLTVVYKYSRGFNGAYGYTYVHTFAQGDNILVWFTAKALDFEEGEPINLTGTVVNFEEYKGTKITKVNRCILKRIDQHE